VKETGVRIVKKSGKKWKLLKVRNTKRLSVAELKNCKGFENYTDEQAEETIKSLEKLSILFYELHMKQKLMRQKLTLIKGGEIYESEQRTAA
jgi:hypothetical protein